MVQRRDHSDLAEELINVIQERFERRLLSPAELCQEETVVRIPVWQRRSLQLLEELSSNQTSPTAEPRCPAKYFSAAIPEFPQNILSVRREVEHYREMLEALLRASEKENQSVEVVIVFPDTRERILQAALSKVRPGALEPRPLQGKGQPVIVLRTENQPVDGGSEAAAQGEAKASIRI